MGKLAVSCLLYRIREGSSYKELHLPRLPDPVSRHRRRSSPCYSSRVAPSLLLRQSLQLLFQRKRPGQLQRRPTARLKGIRESEVGRRNKNEPVSSLRLRLFITSINYLLYCQSWDCIQKDGRDGKSMYARE